MWKKAIVVMFLVFLPHYAGAQIALEKWVRTYDTGGGSDKATALARDQAGNIYVTGVVSGGYSEDYATIKYDTNGNQLWVRPFGRPLSDQPIAIATDVFGNVYVTGFSIDSYAGYDFVTIKYDTNGNELWVKLYDGAYNEWPNSIAVDSSGNVYITGISSGYSGTYDYTTIKYDGNGNELWVRWYDGGLWWDCATSLVVDSSGNIYVTGYSASTSGSDDFATVKYDTNGNELWVKRYDGGYEDRPAAIAIDSSSNVYITGERTNAGGWKDYVTLKYDANGNEQWIRNYDAGYGYEDTANAMKVDALGNVYVTGSSDNMDRVANIVTIKYGSNGDQLWTKRYDSGNTGDRPSAMAVDATNSVYITGIIQPSGMPTDAVTLKYDTSGNEMWVSKFDGGSADSTSGIAIDSLGNVYVTGTTITSTGFFDYLTIMYTQKGR